MSNVPMTRVNEALVIHDQQNGHSVTFAGLHGGRIVLCDGSWFSISDDEGAVGVNPLWAKMSQVMP